MIPKKKRAPGGALNAKKSIPIDMSLYDLSTVAGCFALLSRIAEAGLHGEIGSRTHGALNNTIRIILTYHSDIAQVAQNQQLIEESKRRIKELEEKLDAQQKPHEGEPQEVLEQ
jgi:hypothetical protein